MSATGTGVDSQGGPVIDPTKNVLDLVEAGSIAAKAQLSLNMKMTHREIKLHVQRLDDLREMQEKHFEQRLRTEAEHAKELRVAESNRLDAINAVNTTSVAEAAKVVAAGQLALAKQAQDIAEATRLATQTLATTVAEASATSIAPLSAGLQEVQRRQYEQQGAKAQTIDDATDRRAGRTGNLQTISVIIGGFGLLFTVIIFLAGYIAVHG